MSVISYARHSLELSLWRALGHIPHGCFVNIGPPDAEAQGLIQAFQERGWKSLHADRAAAVSDHAGTIHCMRVHVGATASNPFDAWPGTGTLPWIVLVHAPAARGARSAWEEVLLGHGYRYAGSEGPAHFYAHRDCGLDEHHLRLLAPPSPESATGDAAPSGLLLQLQTLQVRLEQSHGVAEEAERRLAEVQARLQQAEERAARLEVEGLAALIEAQQARSLEERLQAVYASSSWRVTKPMRWLSRLRRSPRSASAELVRFARANARRLGDGLLRRLLRLVLAHPRLHRLASRLALRYPRLFQRLRARVVPEAAAGAPATAQAAPVAPSSHTTVLGPRFKTLILDELAHSADPAYEGKS